MYELLRSSRNLFHLLVAHAFAASASEPSALGPAQSLPHPNGQSTLASKSVTSAQARGHQPQLRLVAPRWWTANGFLEAYRHGWLPISFGKPPPEPPMVADRARWMSQRATSPGIIRTRREWEWHPAESTLDPHRSAEQQLHRPWL